MNSDFCVARCQATIVELILTVFRTWSNMKITVCVNRPLVLPSVQDEGSSFLSEMRTMFFHLILFSTFRRHLLRHLVLRHPVAALSRRRNLADRCRISGKAFQQLGASVTILK
jgi:hypothetical protein